MKLSVVVPCYNEALSLNEFYDSLSLALKENKISYELIMVDDGSSDDTYQKLLDLNKMDKNVKIISFQETSVRSKQCMLVLIMLVEIMLQ